MAERITRDNPLSFIRECIRDRRVLWTYHVNMRLGQRFIDREMIMHAADNYELIEEYPDDKYFPSYLVLGRSGQEVFHVLFGADVDVRTFESLQLTILVSMIGNKTLR